MEIIGISGYARAGKDEAAKALVEAHGFTRVAFADKLREVLLALNPRVGVKVFLRETDLGAVRSDATTVYLEDVIKLYGWGGYKETEYGPEVRRLLQRLGTEAGRQLLGDNVWVDAALTGHPKDAKLVIPDVRFPNEAQAIKDAGGVVWRINRPGTKPANAHVSETALDDWDFDWRYENEGDLVRLYGDIVLNYSLTRAGV
jgi:hypothetical protein